VRQAREKRCDVVGRIGGALLRLMVLRSSLLLLLLLLYRLQFVLLSEHGLVERLQLAAARPLQIGRHQEQVARIRRGLLGVPRSTYSTAHRTARTQRAGPHAVSCLRTGRSGVAGESRSGLTSVGSERHRVDLIGRVVISGARHRDGETTRACETMTPSRRKDEQTI
jgi:hypothetical protein